MILWAIACKGPAAGTVPDTERLEVRAELAEHVPTVVSVSWDPPEGATHHVEYGTDRVTPEFDTLPIPLLGLPAGQTVSLRAVSVTPDGQRYESDVVQIDIPDVPASFAPFTAEVLDPARSEAQDGFLLVSVTDLLQQPEDPYSYVAIVDGSGRYVWYVDLPPGHVVVTPSFNPYAPEVLFDDAPITVDEFAATAHRVRLDGTAAEEWPIEQGHHVVAATSETGVAWLSADFRDVGGDSIVTDRLLEVDRPGDDPREVLNLFEDYFGGTFDDRCLHTSTPQQIGTHPDTREWTHSNSLVYLDELDSYFVFSRWIDTLFRVDRATGAIVWQMSGQGGDFTLPGGADPWTSVSDSALWSHGHLTQLWDGGLVMFDNGDHSAARVSAIAEYAWDEEERTVWEVFRYESPIGLRNFILGDARKLPGGNYLAVWSQAGEIAEIAPDGTAVWRLTVGDGRALARAVWVPSLY